MRYALPTLLRPEPTLIFSVEASEPPARLAMTSDELEASVKQAALDQAKKTASSYRDDLVSLAKKKINDTMPAGTGDLALSLIDLVASEDVTFAKTQQLLAAAAGVGVTAGCTYLSSGTLAPLCATAGGVVAGLVQGLFSEPTRQGPDPLAFAYAEIARLKQEKVAIKNKFTPLFGDSAVPDDLRQKFQDLLDVFYDDSFLSCTKPGNAFADGDLLLIDPINGKSPWIDSPWLGGFFVPYTNVYQVLPSELPFPNGCVFDPRCTGSDDKGISSGAGYSVVSNLVNKDPCKNQITQLGCSNITNAWALNQTDDELITQWLSNILFRLADRGVEVSQTSITLLMNTVSNYNAPVLAQIYTLLNDSVRYLIRSKFEERLLVLVAAATTIVQKPMFEAAEKVRTQVEEKFAGSCESNTCRDFLAVNAKQLSKELVELAANGASADQIDSAIIESEQKLSAYTKLASDVEGVSDKQDSMGTGTIILGVLGLGALSWAGVRTYQHKPILPKFLPPRPYRTVLHRTDYPR